ncbi:hypothetical protein VPH35_132280 [Triticum aestivum]
MEKYVDLEKGDAAVEPEEPWPASDDYYIPSPCVLGVLFGAVALVGVVITLVCYGPWPALGVAAVLAAMDYIVVLGAREGFKNAAAMKAQAAGRKYVAPVPCCIYAAMARERRDRLCSAVGTSTTEANQQPKTTAGQAQRASNRTRKLKPYVTGYTDREN